MQYLEIIYHDVVNRPTLERIKQLQKFDINEIREFLLWTIANKHIAYRLHNIAPILSFTSFNSTELKEVNKLVYLKYVVFHNLITPQGIREFFPEYYPYLKGKVHNPAEVYLDDADHLLSMVPSKDILAIIKRLKPKSIRALKTQLSQGKLTYREFKCKLKLLSPQSGESIDESKYTFKQPEGLPTERLNSVNKLSNLLETVGKHKFEEILKDESAKRSSGNRTAS